jgi:hypothetical protein
MNDTGMGDHKSTLHLADWMARKLAEARAGNGPAARPAAKQGPASSRLYKAGSGNGGRPPRPAGSGTTAADRLYRNSVPR